jgi:hypothetical protein
MKAIFAILSCLVLQALADEPVVIATPPVLWVDSLPLLMKERSALVLDTARDTRLRGYLRSWPQKPPLTESEILSQVAETFPKLPPHEHVDLRIEWLFTENPTNFSRSILSAEGILESVCRVGGTKITRTLLVDKENDVIVVHLLADKPGALSFRVSLDIDGADPAKIEKRKEMVIPANEKTGDFVAHAWILPFESDVTPEGNSIVVRGEGEAMVLLTYVKDPQTLADTLNRLGNRYDPGHSPPDLIKIWHGILETKTKSVENSP